jgi:uncharacterized membrane protein
MPEPTTPPPAAPLPPPPFVSQEEILSGKTMAILSYLPVGPIGLIVSIICVAQKNNAFSLYHAKQALTLYICATALYLISIPLIFALCLGYLLMMATGVTALVFCILGIMNANKGECKPLPLIQPAVEKMFGNIKKV